MGELSEEVRRLSRRSPATVALTGIAATLLVALATVPFRAALGAPNVAILLAVVVVATAAFGGRGPAVAVSVVASLAFNLLHTRPYLSLQIHGRQDLVTAVLLVVLGLVAGEATERAWRWRDAELRRVHQLERLHRVAELATVATDAGAIWPTVRDTLCEELHLGRCWFEPSDHQGFPFPELAHNGSVGPLRENRRWQPGGFELPRNGVSLAVTADGRRLGRLVLLPDPGHGLSLVDRRVAVAVADQFGMVAARSGPLHPLW